MHGGLSKEGLKKLEEKIDKELCGRNPKTDLLESKLTDLIGKYSYEVEYHNILHKKDPYKNKYGTTTPIHLRFGLSLANFLANGVPVEEKHSKKLPSGKHPVDSKTMDSFIKSVEHVMEGTPSVNDAARIMSYDPSPYQFLRSMSHFASQNQKPKEETYCGFKPGFLIGKRF